MVEYYNEKTKRTANWSDIVNQNPTTSFPKNPSDDIAKHFGWEVLYNGEVPQPSFDGLKILSFDGIEKNDQNHWVKKWSIVNRHKAYKDADGKTVTKKSQDDAYIKSLTDKFEIPNRAKRDTLLKQTDHYGLSDLTMTDKMKKYRQALRDLPTNENWPDLKESDWPTLS